MDLPDHEVFDLKFAVGATFIYMCVTESVRTCVYAWGNFQNNWILVLYYWFQKQYPGV